MGDGLVSSIGGVLINPGTVSALAVTGDQLHVGGTFNRAGAREAINAATWQAGEWRAFGLGVGGPAYVVHRFGNEVLVGGSFPTAGGVAVNSIARWNGREWSALGDGVWQNTLPGQVHAVAPHGPEVYVAGVFNRAGSVSALNVARWNGSEWSPLGGGLGGQAAVVRALVLTADGTLYAGGFFTTPAGVSAIARWDGTEWSALGSGIRATPGFAAVHALAALGNDLYAGGAFNQAGGIATLGIARWNGAAWSAVGGGMNSTVLALAVHGNDLFAGGYFTTAGGVATRRIARWDGSTWTALGDGLGNTTADAVTALAVDGRRVFAGGLFTTLGDGTPANYLASWDGQTWSAVGAGTGTGSPPAVYGLAAANGQLYAGGTFARAGESPSIGFAIWNYLGEASPQPQVRLALQSDGSRRLHFVGLPGQELQVWSTRDLNQPFTTVSAILTGTGGELTYEDSTPAGPARYYQVRVLP